MRILLDHNLDRRLKLNLQPLECSTTYEQRWSELTNGELLSAAESDGFDVLLTADSNIPKQQNLTGRKISILVLRAFDNRRSTHVEMLEDVKAALVTLDRGAIQEIFHPAFEDRV